MERIRTVIAGGGLAGLTAASVLSEAVVLEKEKIPGGLLRSPEHDGFIIDLVPHVFFTPNLKAIEFFEEKVGAGRFFLHDSDVRIWSHQALTRFPFQCSLYGLPADVIVECLYEFATARANPPASIDNFYDFAVATFGKGIVKHFLRDYNRKLWGVSELSELTADWVGGKVITIDLKDVIEGAFVDRRYTSLPNAQFRYPKEGGIETLALRTAAHVERLELECEIAAIDPDARTVTTTDGRGFAYEHLIYTLPLSALPAVIGNLPGHVVDAVNSLTYRDVVAIHLGVGREQTVKWHWMYYPEPEDPFYRVSFPSNMAPSTAPPGCTSIIAEVAVDPGSPLDEERVTEDCIRALVRSGIIRDDDPILLKKSYRLSPGYVVYDAHRARSVETIGEYFREKGIVPAGRFGEWRFFNMDHTIMSGLNAAATIVGDEGP